MASNPTAPSQAMLSKSKPANLTDIVRSVLAPIASLKLTVFLLVLAVFVTWIITLEQAAIDIWELKNKHFSQAFVYVPFNTFFPKNWFPNGPNIPYGFILPSGFTLIAGMLINLTAAHVLRFKIQASGWRLVTGIAVLIASAVLTWTIVFNYQDASGFGGQPPIPWTQMWKFMQVAVFGFGIASVYGFITLGKERKIEKAIYALFAITFFGLLIWSVMKGEAAFIGDSAMRVMWQLVQSTIAAIAVLVGCVLIFNRKAGIVLLHLGIAGLLANEIYVSATNEELRVSFEEGQTVHHAIDLRETELVVIDRSDAEFDQMTTIPGSLLQSTEDLIDDERLPFKIRCIEYIQNSDVIRVGPHAENKADSGFGTAFIAVELEPTSGVDPNAKPNRASVYLEIVDRSNSEAIGKYLATQVTYENELVDTISVGDKKYQIGLRYKTVYTPYSLKLKDTKAEYYVGTDTPSWFSSEFVIDDPNSGVTSDQKIWMNNPLRYQDQTFYQVTYGENEGVEFSGIQIVRNKGWMIPYVCCMFVVVGLVAQFQQSLISYLSKNNHISDAKDNGKNGTNWLAWAPTIVLVGIFGIYGASKFARSMSPTLTKSKASEIRLDLLGQLPVTFDGRVQPLDSFARNLSRQMSNREFIADEFGKKQPAIRWLADMMFGANAADGYEILRIEDPNVQNALGLKHRKGMKYTFAEIRESNPKLIELLVEAQDLPEDKRSIFHSRLQEVYHKSRQLMAAQLIVAGTEGRFDEGDILGRIEVASNLAAPSMKKQIPYALYSSGQDKPWMPMPLAIEQLWLQELAAKHSAASINELATKLLDSEIADMKPELVKRRLISQLMQYDEIVEGLQEKFGLADKDELAEALAKNWEQLPKELLADQQKSAELMVDAQLNSWRSGKEEILSEMLPTITASDDLKTTVDQEVVDQLSLLKKAYNGGDATMFNKTLEKHLARFEEAPPKDWNQTSQRAEISYNYFSPFHFAMVVYLMGFVTTILSWVSARKPMNRAAFWLISLALFVHLAGVAARVVISGRPPITNFVFVIRCGDGWMRIDSVAHRMLDSTEHW